MSNYRLRILTPEDADERYVRNIDANGLAGILDMISTGRLSEAGIDATITLAMAEHDSLAVTLTGTQTIDGFKTFVRPITLPDNSLAIAKIVGLSTALSAKADLVNGQIPAAQIPALKLNDVFVVNSQAAMLALVAVKGDMAIRTDTPKTFVLATNSPATLADWKEVTATGTVTSVAGRTGNVGLTKTDVGLPNVDNTADSAKPISLAVQNALDTKADASTVVTLTGAQTISGVKTYATAPAVPDSSFSISKTTGLQTALDAKASNAALTSAMSGLPETIRDTIGATLIAGTGITITVDDAADTITINSTATGGGGSMSQRDILHAAIPTNNSTDCGPAFQAIHDAGYALDLNKNVTYYINTPVFVDGTTLQSPWVVNLNGACLRLGTGLPKVSNVVSGTTSFAFLSNIKRTAWNQVAGSTFALSETVRATGTSGKYANIIIRDGWWLAPNGKADVGLICTYTTSVALENVRMRGGRCTLAWFDYSEHMTISGATADYLPGAEQIDDAWYVYGESEGDGMTINGIKVSGVGGAVRLTKCRGAMISGLVSGRCMFIDSIVSLVAPHQESLYSTFPVNIMVRNSQVEVIGGVTYATRPEMRALASPTYAAGMWHISDISNDMASTVTFRDHVFNYWQRDPFQTDSLDPHVYFAHVNAATTINFSNCYVMQASSGTPGKWYPSSSPILDSRVAAAKLSDFNAKHHISTKNWSVRNTVAAYASNGTPANMAVMALSTGSPVAQRALANPTDLNLFASNNVGPGTLVSGTTYNYTVAFRNSAGQYTQFLTPVALAANSDQTMQLRLLHNNSDCVAVIWRKNAAGVDTAPDWYVEIPITSGMVHLLDMGTHIDGWVWQSATGRIPATVAASNQTVAG